MSRSHYIIPIFVPHEGCPHNCVFCNQNLITGSTSNVNSKYVKDTVEAYLKTLPKKNAVIELSFFGGTFTAIPIEKQTELLEVAKFYKDKGYIKYIHMSTRPDYIDEAILSNLKKHSVDIIELGVQSMDEEVLLKSGRGHTAKDVVNASNMIKKYGITLGHQMMLGLPGDTFKKDIETTEQLICLKPELMRIYPSLVIKDTPMEKMYVQGKYTPYSLEEAIKISKVIYGRFIANNINVIRVGLQPTEEINVGRDIVAGPFHPAFKELVEGSIIKDMIIENIPESYNGTLEISVNPKDVSKLFSNRKVYFNDIKKQLSTINMQVKQCENIERGEISLKIGSTSINLSIYDYLTNKYKEGYSRHL